MKKKILRSLTILTLLAFALSITAWAVAFVKRPPHVQSAQANETKQKTLREIVKERDVERERHVEYEAEYGDFHSLAKASHAVVLGRVIEKESAFDEDDHIFTTYTVDVQRVLKDKTSEVIPILRQLGEQQSPAPLATPLKIVRSGGVVNVNGRRASDKVNGKNESLNVGENYILFLWWDYAYKAYLPAGGSSGIVLVDDTLRVRPLASAKEIKQRYEGLNLETFVNEVLR